jgi:hypothetical protein
MLRERWITLSLVGHNLLNLSCHLQMRISDYNFTGSLINSVNMMCASYSIFLSNVMYTIALVFFFCRYAPLDSCLFTTAITTSDERYNWPVPWPERLDVSYASVPDDSASNKEKFEADTKYWKQLISEVYFSDFPFNWSSIAM